MRTNVRSSVFINTIVGGVCSTAEGNVMIMLQPCLFYFLLKIGIVSQIKNRNATFFSYCPEFISIEHSYRFIA